MDNIIFEKLFKVPSQKQGGHGYITSYPALFPIHILVVTDIPKGLNSGGGYRYYDKTNNMFKLSLHMGKRFKNDMGNLPIMSAENKVYKGGQKKR